MTNPPTPSLIDKTLEHSMHSVFQRLDSDHRGSLTMPQFERFLFLNCFDFVLDFFDKNEIRAMIFKE